LRLNKVIPVRMLAKVAIPETYRKLASIRSRYKARGKCLDESHRARAADIRIRQYRSASRRSFDTWRRYHYCVIYILLEFDYGRTKALYLVLQKFGSGKRRDK
jgi:hypothetical protein